MADLAEEERLDELDPLRHLREDDELVPQQPHSVQNERVMLSFPTANHGPAQIELVADAKPGCGGIAWPAGEVGLLGRSRLAFP
jgi:protein N-lysine methyltransferase METTL21A